MKYQISALLVLCATTSALAADLPSSAPVPYARAPILAAYNWSGVYVGVMGGYGWSQNVTVAGLVLATNDIKGAFAGGTIVFNWQGAGSPFVLGVEADGAWSDIKYREAIGFGVTFEDRIRALGSVTGRAGFAADAALIYLKGGYAFAENRMALLLGNATLGSESHFHSGWTVGGGLEYGFTPNWSAKAEYMYVSLLKQNYLPGLGGVGFAADIHTVKFGLNYRFGWGGPVVARY